MAIDLPDPRSVTAIASALLFITVCIAALMARARRGSLDHPYAVRLIMTSFVILAALRLYSATSFIWADLVGEGILSLLRYVVLAATITVIVILLAVLVYYTRVIRDGEGR